jgi:hypothetical protein
MQHDSKQQEQQTCISHEDRLPFIEEIVVLRSLARDAGIADHLLANLDNFKHEVEHLDESVWEQKEVRNQSRNELVRLSLAVLRAYGSGPC